MRCFGLIGFPLSHSFSGRFFAEKFEAEGLSDCRYNNFQIENIEMVKSVLTENPDLKGFNVTLPYKQQIIPFLSYLSKEAVAIGAVNCVRITDAGLEGHNTDAYGFSKSLLEFIGDSHPSTLVLGTGGAAKAVCYALTQLDINYQQVSRFEGKNLITYDQLTPRIIVDNKLIINCTPLGTFPKTEEFPPVDYNSVGTNHFLFDLVYNPSMTEFMRRGAEQGASVHNGYDMLVNQAERSWEIWNAGNQ